MIDQENKANINAVITIRHRDGISKEDFYAYWTNVHAPVMARMPHTWGYVLHHVEAARIPFWNLPDKIEKIAPPEHQIEGFAELSYLDEESVRKAFVVSDAPGGYTHLDAQVMNWVGLFYTSYKGSVTLRDELGVNNSGYSYILTFQIKEEADRNEAINWIKNFAQKASNIAAFSRVRVHTFSEYDYNQDESLMPPNMRHIAFKGEALDAVIEVVARSPIALSLGFSQWNLGEEAITFIRSLHSYRRNRHYVMLAGGEITEHGIRTPYVTDLINKLGAISQLDPRMRKLMLYGKTE